MLKMDGTSVYLSDRSFCFSTLRLSVTYQIVSSVLLHAGGNISWFWSSSQDTGIWLGGSSATSTYLGSPQLLFCKKTPLPILKSLEPNIIAKEYCMYRTMTVLFFFFFFFPLCHLVHLYRIQLRSQVCVCVLRILQWLHQSDFKTYTSDFIN